jgi:two-component sensor histidine kinase
VARCVSFRLTPDKLAVRQARLRVRELGDLPAQTVADAELVVSELVANSLLHARLGAGDAIDVSLVREADRLLIEVDDHGSFSGRPRSRAGMGVRVLDALCDDWSADSGQVSASLPIGAARAASPARRPAAAQEEGKPSSPRRWLRRGSS